MTAKKQPTSKRSARLSTGIYHRGNRIWARYKDGVGKWKDVSLGLTVGQEADAQKLLVEIKRRIAAGQELGLEPGGSQPTFAGFFRWWIEQRKARHARSWKDDESRIRTHVLDHLGAMQLDAITPLHLERAFLRVRDSGKAPKTVWNTYAAVRAMFRDAVKRGFLASSPCLLGDEELGPMIDKDPEWRATALYERAELKQLMFDERVRPSDRIWTETPGVAVTSRPQVARRAAAHCAGISLGTSIRLIPRDSVVSTSVVSVRRAAS